MILLNSDCIEEMAKMPDGLIDLIVTDPAYKTISGGDKGSITGILEKNDGKIFKENNTKPKEYISEFYRILAAQSHLYIMTNFFNLEEMLRELRASGFNIHNLLIWNKNNAVPNRWYMKNVEYAIFARKGPAFAINNMGSKTCVQIDNPKSPKIHPTEKPVELMEFYISNSSREGQTIFDPFMGSGTTGVACQKLNREFIGCELDPEHFRVAESRLLI